MLGLKQLAYAHTAWGSWPLETPIRITPYPLAALLCDQVVVEADTQKKTLVGIFDRIGYATLPTVQPLSLYVKLTDAQGTYRFVVDYVHVPTDRKLASAEARGIVSSRLESFDLIMRVPAMIDQPGEYEFRIFANDAYVTRAAFIAAPVQPAQGVS